MPERILVVGDQRRARELRDAGAEVIFLDAADGEQVARTAVQEDVVRVVTSDPSAVGRALADLDAADIAVDTAGG